MSTHQYALGVVGTGHIAAVLVRRLIDSGYLKPDRIIVAPSRKLAAHPLPVAVAADNAAAVRGARLVMIAVTPQKFADAAATFREAVSDNQVVISLMAGVTTQRVARTLAPNAKPKATEGTENTGEARVEASPDIRHLTSDILHLTSDIPHPTSPLRVIRAMPNLPFGLGRGVTGLFRGAGASQDDFEEARHLFAAGGVTVELEQEGLMDAVTAVAGSGPAYFYYFVEMMMAGGMAAGLSRAAAQTLAAHACVGAGAMLLETDASPADLRAQVTSPGGTTQAAMNRLTQSQVAEHVKDAVLAAFNRSRELSQLQG